MFLLPGNLLGLARYQYLLFSMIIIVGVFNSLCSATVCGISNCWILFYPKWFPRNMKMLAEYARYTFWLIVSLKHTLKNIKLATWVVSIPTVDTYTMIYIFAMGTFNPIIPDKICSQHVNGCTTLHFHSFVHMPNNTCYTLWCIY